MYEPCDFVVVRAPLLPLDTCQEPAAGGTPLHELPEDVRQAVAVGSLPFRDALESATGEHAQHPAVQRTLRRYLVRMSTRATPFGLFAGVGLASWGDTTDVMVASGPRRHRTRPDMAWLLAIVDRAESDPAIRRSLRVVANHAAFVRAGRVVLTERVSRGEAFPAGVSIRATAVVRGVLDDARSPIGYEDLTALTLTRTSGATAAQVENLLAQLCEQTLLLTTLRPPLTVVSPAQHVIDHLEGISAATGLRAALVSVVDAAREWDVAPTSTSGPRYQDVADRAAAVAPFDRSPLQVDSLLPLIGATVSRLVGEEAARAAEILLRMSPSPRGPSHLVAYRRMFESRYGARREVPVLELLDPNVGLGPPAFGQQASSDPAPLQQGSSSPAQELVELALTAIRGGSRCIELDESTLDRLETYGLTAATAPRSVELNAVVAATSRATLDAGDFRLVVGANVGSMAAGRTLGRFGDMLTGAPAALARVASAEEPVEPGKLWAELAYAPRSRRLANVCIRPNARQFEIALGVSSGLDPSRTIPVDELLVGVRDGAFYVRWSARDEDLVITAGHMLNSARAPLLCRFLSEVSRDSTCQLAGFQWGPAARFPFLPRVESGRIVLALARWRLGAPTFPAVVVKDRPAFLAAVDGWRARWDVPDHVVLSAGDRGLRLDLTRPEDVDELRRALRSGARSAVVTEVFPDRDQSWLTGSDGRRFASELVVPLMRRVCSPNAERTSSSVVVPHAPDQRPPGSDWLFVKLFVGREMEDDLLAGPIRDFAAEMTSSGFTDWFFLRYSESGRHIRLRVRGDRAALLAELLPRVCEWAADLMEAGAITRFSFDTYEREVERFGGPQATSAAERLFGADSQVTLELLRRLQTREVTLQPVALAVLTVQALLAGLGLDAEAQERWCREHASNREESGDDYRAFKAVLRPLLVQPSGPGVTEALARLEDAAARFQRELDDVASTGRLTRPPSELRWSIIHLHLNRLLGGASATEQRVIGLLGRLQRGLAASSRASSPRKAPNGE